MSEFIDSMKLQLSDLETVGKLGFVDGISNIIINNFNFFSLITAISYIKMIFHYFIPSIYQKNVN